jgi:hypothetical protein
VGPDGGAAPDAGGRDAGNPPPDAGDHEDAGEPEEDAGEPEEDAGEPEEDGGEHEDGGEDHHDGGDDHHDGGDGLRGSHGGARGLAAACAGLVPDSLGQVTAAGTCADASPPAASPSAASATDLHGLTLAISDGSSTCAGCVLGQWVDASGAAASGGFVLLTGFDPGPATWLDTAPLIGGGVAVRRVDHNPAAAGGEPNPAAGGVHTRWLATLGHGSTTPKPAPDWLSPDTSLAIVQGGKAYALFPLASPGTSCPTTADIFSPAGDHCAHLGSAPQR